MNRTTESRFNYRGRIAGLGQDSGGDTFFNTSALDFGMNDDWPATPEQAPAGDGLFTQAEIDAIIAADSAAQPPANASNLPDVAKWIAQGLTLAQAWQVSQINIQRAQRGQPLLNPSQISALSPRVNVGMSADTKNLVLWGGGLLLAALALR